MYLKTKNVYLAMLILIGSAIIISSCSKDDPVVAPTLSYSDATVAVGEGGPVTPTLSGDKATFSIVSAGDAEDFVLLNATTGEISVAAESVTGVYEVKIKATNSAGSSEATATITIGVNPAFNPVGKDLKWRYFINQEANFTLNGLDGDLVGLPIPFLTLPIGWPTANTPEEDVWQHFLLTQIERLIFQVPGDEACTKGDTLQFSVESDMTVKAICTEGGPAEIGTWKISYAAGQYSFEVNLVFSVDAGFAFPYVIENASFANFTDPETGASYNALMGRVNNFTTPTDFTSQATMTDITKLGTPQVDVVLQVVQ